MGTGFFSEFCVVVPLSAVGALWLGVDVGDGVGVLVAWGCVVVGGVLEGCSNGLLPVRNAKAGTKTIAIRMIAAVMIIFWLRPTLNHGFNE